VPAFAAMFVGGSVWLLGMTSLNVAAQIAVPHWVTGRALAMYQIYGPGWHCVGRPDMECRRFEKHHFDDAEYRSAIHGVQPGCGGPVMVSIEYEINPAQAEAFRQAMKALRTIRFRDGVVFWGLISRH
jgi:Transmembrane secretion effector